MEQVSEQAIELTAEPIALIENANPCFAERRVESRRRGFCTGTCFMWASSKERIQSTSMPWSTPVVIIHSASCTPAGS